MAILDVPEWLQSYIQDWADKLKLHEWTIKVQMALCINGDPAIAGYCEQFADINTCVLTFRADIDQSDEEAQTNVVHELLHVAMSRVDRLVETLIIPGLPAAAQELAKQSYISAVEAHVDRLAKAIWPLGHEMIEDDEPVFTSDAIHDEEGDL